jgi:hypothetical protein
MVAKHVWIRVPNPKECAKDDEMLYTYRIPIESGSSYDTFTVLSARNILHRPAK